MEQSVCGLHGFISISYPFKWIRLWLSWPCSLLVAVRLFWLPIVFVHFSAAWRFSYFAHDTLVLLMKLCRKIFAFFEIDPLFLLTRMIRCTSVSYNKKIITICYTYWQVPQVQVQFNLRLLHLIASFAASYFSWWLSWRVFIRETTDFDWATWLLHLAAVACSFSSSINK